MSTVKKFKSMVRVTLDDGTKVKLTYRMWDALATAIPFKTQVLYLRAPGDIDEYTGDEITGPQMCLPDGISDNGFHDRDIDLATPFFGARSITRVLNASLRDRSSIRTLMEAPYTRALAGLNVSIS